MPCGPEIPEVGKEGIDLTMRTGIGGSKYLPGRTEDSVAELLDDDSKYEILSPRYLEKIGASLCSRCIIRYDRTFNTYTSDMVTSDSLKDTIKTVSEDTELHDFAIAYICAAQLGFTPETQKDLFFDKEDKVTLPEGVDIRAIGEEMFEYMEKNEVDVYMGIGESFVDIRYLDEKAVAAVDEYMEENDINKEYVKMTEMSDNDKRRIIKYRIGKYRSENKLSVGTYIKRFEDETIGICIKYYLAHEADKPVIEKFIADRDYDKLFRVEYEFVGDPNADPDSIITDPKTIIELINGFIKEKGFDSYAYQGNNCVYLTINGRLENEDDYSQIKEFMTEKHIDQYMVYTDILESGINGTISTLRGDANLDGMVDLADLTAVAKYNLSNEAYPLANDTAYANADMNGDGVVDGLDTSALIEDQLGK